MAALLDTSLSLKGDAFCSNGPVGDYTLFGDAMDHNTASTISPPQYRFPDVRPPQYPSRSLSPPSSPSDSPSTSTSALPSANSSSLSLRPSPHLALAPTHTAPPPVLSLRDFYLPTLTPDEILDTLDHLASIAPKKKSHARKQPAGHIPRPRNAFILFRCLFVSQQAVPASVEKDHRNISRIAGKVWKSMSNEERDPWVKASELEKARHEAKWPGYRYNPVQPQVLPRRFGQGILKAPSVAPDSERMARPTLRMRPKREDEDDFYPLYGSQPISQYARVGSVPPLEMDRDGKCAHVASLVREGKQGLELEAAVRGESYYSTQPPEFTMPWGRPAFNAPVAVPTPVRGATQNWYEMSLPPDSPPPTPAHSRLMTRRSSSCPPLPPVQSGAFPFNNPNPWAAAAYTSQSSSPAPSPFAFSYTTSPGPQSQASSSDSPFAFPPPSPYSGNEYEAQDEHRPLTAPEHQELSPRLNLNISSNLTQRRGSSLDRAIASSSIAGAFGGTLSKPGHVHWNPEAIHNFTRPNHPSPNFSGQATPTEFTDSSRSATPALSPQSSFEFQRGRSEAPRSLETSLESQPTQSMTICDEDDEDEDRGRPRHEQILACPRPSVDFIEPYSRTPPMSPPSPATKVPARLFGSQGARLGLDLDLDVPLSLDVSFNSPPSPASTSTPYSAQNPASSASPESAYPHTPSSPPNGSNPPYNFSYTQALMDTDPDVGADEFRASP